tara:strand:- start:905 stop:1495 length:591 start_codon:yes stop_codon:yes gene_type:complete
MKRSALKEFIKGEIITTLSEASAEDVSNQKDLNKELEKTAKLSKDIGLEEGAIDPAEYGDIGAAYLKGFGKEHTLSLDQLEELGRKIVKQIYKGDFEAAKAKHLSETNEVNEETGDDDDVDAKAIKAAKGARGKHKKLDLAIKALKNITTEMKSLAREYSKADGVEKEKIKDQLKSKTPKKKELEALVAQLEKNVV